MPIQNIAIYVKAIVRIYIASTTVARSSAPEAPRYHFNPSSHTGSEACYTHIHRTRIIPVILLLETNQPFRTPFQNTHTAPPETQTQL